MSVRYKLATVLAIAGCAGAAMGGAALAARSQRHPLHHRARTADATVQWFSTPVPVSIPGAQGRPATPEQIAALANMPSASASAQSVPPPTGPLPGQ